MHILLAEDETKVAQHIAEALRSNSYVVDCVDNGLAAVEAGLSGRYDALILDVMMPGLDGLDVIKQLRQQQNTTPVLLVTARGEVSERVEGLLLGADDYLAKPFAMNELLARVVALTRRTNAPVQNTLFFEDLRLDLRTRGVTRGAHHMELSLREYSLVEYFLRHPGRVFSKTELIEKVWSWNFNTGTNVVEVYIQRLRKKLEEHTPTKLIHTVRGEGYVLKKQQ